MPVGEDEQVSSFGCSPTSILHPALRLVLQHPDGARHEKTSLLDRKFFHGLYSQAGFACPVTHGAAQTAEYRAGRPGSYSRRPAKGMVPGRAVSTLCPSR